MSNFTTKPTFLQPLLFNYKDVSDDYGYNLSQSEIQFLSFFETVLNLIKNKIRSKVYHTGRKPYSLYDIFAVRMVMMFYRFSTITDTITFIKSNSNIREITGLKKVPSSPVISKKTKYLIEFIDFDKMFEKLTCEFFANRIVGHLSIDSTIVDAREKPINNITIAKKKKGRKVHGSKEEKEFIKSKKEKGKLDYECKYGNYRRYVNKLNKKCSKTGKKNSKGNMEWHIGYKIHLAVDDYGIPVSSIITGANVNDVKPAIPLMRMANERCRFLYTLMDGGYSSKAIIEVAERLGSVAIIDFHADRNGNKIEMEKYQKERYKKRTTVERTNSEIKECFLPDKLYSRGKKAIFDMNIAIIFLTLKRMQMWLTKVAKIPKKSVA